MILSAEPCHESHLLILMAMLGGRWQCDSYFIDEKTGIGRLIDLFKVIHPLRIECWVLPWQPDCTGGALTTRLYF